jgi:hypothetical protein
MVEVNLELEVPTSLEDIELWQYQKYMGIVKQNEEATNPEAVDFVNRKLIEIFCDVSLKDVMNIPLKEYSKITEVLSNAFDADTPLVQRFELEGIEFGFIPNLAANFGAKWGWYQSIYTLAKGDVLKFRSITETPIHQCMMYLAFEKEKLDLEHKLIKQNFK